MKNSPPTETQIQTVTTFQDLISTPFQEPINALCWSRQLQGDFAEIVKKINLQENMTTIKMEQLQDLDLSEQGQLARNILFQDFQNLKAQGAAPILNLIRHYDRDDAFPYFPTDVYSWHVDRSPIPVDTFLCTYHGASSEILPNAQAQQKVLIPEVRAELLKLHDEPTEDFEEFLKEFFFDLHYQALPQAEPIDLGIGHLWRLAIDHPERQVLPCVHRAPVEKEGECRLMMIC